MLTKADAERVWNVIALALPGSLEPRVDVAECDDGSTQYTLTMGCARRDASGRSRGRVGVTLAGDVEIYSAEALGQTVRAGVAAACPYARAVFNDGR